jgi:hypothetical protein
MAAPHTKATSVEPSDEDAIRDHHALLGAEVCDQVAPEFVETKIGPYHIAAAAFVPSAEHARKNVLPLGKLAVDHDDPAFVEYITRLTPADADVAANKVMPFEELAICHQGPIGALVAIKFCAWVNRKPSTVNTLMTMISDTRIK